MTNAELVALLREAREDVDAMGNGDLCRAIDRALAIHDAALAEHDTPNEAEWAEVYWDIRAAKINGAQAVVRKMGDRWCWEVMRSGEDCATEDEAKAAAIAAARGLK